MLLLYTDGVTETLDTAGTEHGLVRLLQSVNGSYRLSLQGLVNTCMDAVNDFRGGAAKSEDSTIMALRFTG